MYRKEARILRPQARKKLKVSIASLLDKACTKKHTHTQRWTGISVTGSSKKLTDGSTPFPRYYSHDGPSPMKKPCTWKHMIICGAGHRWMVVAVASLLLKKARLYYPVWVCSYRKRTDGSTSLFVAEWPKAQGCAGDNLPKKAYRWTHIDQLGLPCYPKLESLQL